MFGLSPEHLVVLLLAALFVLGPERLPEAVRWAVRQTQRARLFAAGAQQRIEAELGEELRELRKPLPDLRALRAPGVAQPRRPGTPAADPDTPDGGRFSCS